MQIFKHSLHCLAIELHQRAKEYQTWMLFSLLCIVLHQYSNETFLYADTIGYKVAPWIFPFINHTRLLKILILTLFMPFICTTPRITAIHTYIIIRSKHLAYFLGQCFYIVFASIVYSFLVMFLPILLNLTKFEWNTDWGKIIGTLSQSNISGFVPSTISYSSNIIKHFTPIQAMLHSFSLMVLSLLFIGLLMYIFNMITPKYHTGILVGTFFILFDFFLATDIVYSKLLWLSPLSWSNLSIIDYQHTTRNPTLVYCYTFCIIGIICFFIILCILQKRMRSQFHS